jgi:acetaldehyde dehydrogenase
VPGYRLKQEVQFERFGDNKPAEAFPGLGEFNGIKVDRSSSRWKARAHYLPSLLPAISTS